MAEILFYHMTEKTLNEVLPGLVERSLARDWNVVIQTPTQETAGAIDGLLWTFREDSFIPHSSVKDGNENLQPVWIAIDEDNPNNSQIRFLVNRAEIDDASAYERIVYMFDGHDNEALEHARGRWKHHQSQTEHSITYWQQNPNGGWEKKA